jgi:hypothetical protein
MSDSRINLEKDAPTVPPSPPTSSSAGAAPGPASVPSEPPIASEIAQIAEKLAQELLECLSFSTAWLLKAGQILDHYQGQLAHGDMTAIYSSGRLPWGQRYCQVLASMARNPALSDPKLLQMLPSSMAALEVIATHLNAELIQEGLRSRALHRGLTRQTALAEARNLRRQALLKKPTTTLI